MEEEKSNSEGEEMRAKLFMTPAAKLIQAKERAESFAKNKEAHNACRELIRSVALTRIIYGDGHWRLAEALANLAHSYVMLQGLPVQAMHHANSAKNIIFMGKAYPSASADDRGNILSVLVTIYYTLGIANLMQKNGKESYHNLQKSEKFVKELQGSDFRGIPELKVSEKDLLAALGRASLQKNMLDLPAKHFEKAIDIIITSEGKSAPELIDLYLDMARSEQVKKNHEKSIGYLLQAHSLSVALHTKFSAGAASTALALGKAYAATGEEKYAEAAELYLGESLMSYKAALGMDHPKAIHALEYFSKWLGRVGKRKQAYDLLKESFKSQQDPCSDFNKLAVERLYIMGCICLAEEKIEEAYQLLSKCMQIQSAIYGPCHKKCKKVQELLDMLKM
ncbi:tetratricopeptide repeat protein 23-like [Varanus komodoensis]|uniref:tetratricopeptide repeat protein 23-like n=1 Tax=Varanus komodoensis TaxID=61221 RepID=UPI001CF7AC3F|nr:tetratricopeptide repeat protein 23-like [Varanus komodoensis]